MSYVRGNRNEKPDMSFLKLPKPAWKLTDEEYVMRTRRALRWSKPWFKAGSILWLVIVVGVFLTTLQMVGVALDHPSGPEHSPMAAAYLLGGMAGGMMGFTLLKAVVLVGETWAMERTCRILVKTWERMKELEQSNEPSGNSKLNAPSP